MFVDTDLHGHTLFSDGRATPEDYVEFRHRIGMRAIAIADHDLMAGVRRGAAAAAKSEMLFIPALEVTSFLRHGEGKAAEQFHVLAYFPLAMLEDYKLEGTALYHRGLLVQDRWRTFMLEWMSTLSPEDRAALDPEGQLEKLPAPVFPALQSCILQIFERTKHLSEPFREHHVSFWEGDTNKDIFAWSPEEAIEMIRGDGAVDVVAHPTRYRDKERTQKVLELASGIEVYTSRHKAEVAQHYREMAERLRKHWTSSSDDHQNARYVKPPCGTPVRTLERICQKNFPMSVLLSELGAR